MAIVLKNGEPFRVHDVKPERSKIADLFDERTPGKIHILGTIIGEGMIVGRKNGESYNLWLAKAGDSGYVSFNGGAIDTCLGSREALGATKDSRAEFTTNEAGELLLFGQPIGALISGRTSVWNVAADAAVSVPDSVCRIGGTLTTWSIPRSEYAL